MGWGWHDIWYKKVYKKYNDIRTVSSFNYKNHKISRNTTDRTTHTGRIKLLLDLKLIKWPFTVNLVVGHGMNFTLPLEGDPRTWVFKKIVVQRERVQRLQITPDPLFPRSLDKQPENLSRKTPRTPKLTGSGTRQPCRSRNGHTLHDWTPIHLCKRMIQSNFFR